MNVFLNRSGMKLMFTQALVSISLLSCALKENPQKNLSSDQMSNSLTNNSGTSRNIDTATFGTGCFWCTEAIFQQLKGVLKVTSGYSGGSDINPTYKDVSTGTTGHAEVIQIVFDPAEISFDDLLEVFWETHDPTTLNRQGNDIGTQYRSVIFYHDAEQKAKSEKYKKELNESGAFDNPIVTEISPYTAFYKAEDYHQDYYNNNGSQPYCYNVIRPKLEKFKKVFKNKIRQ